MTTYKLSNTVKKDMLRSVKSSKGQVNKQKLSFAYLNDLFNTYPVVEWDIERYCCYGEDRSCWIDCESSWLSLIHKNPFCLNREIYMSIKGTLNRTFKNKTELGKRSMFTAEIVKQGRRYLNVCIPLRDKMKFDYWIVFRADEELFK